MCFLEAHVKYLPRVLSDHSPVLISFTSMHILVATKKPLWFYLMWISYPNYHEIATTSWNNQPNDLLRKVSRMAKAIHDWAKLDFGDVFWKMKALLGRLGGIQHALESGLNVNLLDLHY